MTPDRRSVLLGLSALAGAASAGSATAGSLSARARAAGLFYGSAVRWRQLTSDPDLASAVLRECDWLTPEIEMKWAVLEPAEGQGAFAEMDSLAAFAKLHNRRLRGHNLLWPKELPAWAARAFTAGAGWDLISRHFAAVMTRYADDIDQWDVVNEPILTGERMDGLRDGPLLSTFGPDYIHRALDEARRWAPNGKLMINEYGLEYDLVPEKDRRYLFLELLEKLKIAGAPLDGVGLQSHLDLNRGPVSQKSISMFLDRVQALGLFVVITELDIKEKNYTATPQQRDREVGDEAARFLDIALAHPAVKGVLTWGLSDTTSWLEVTAADRARFPGAWRAGDGPGLNRGLPLDAGLHPGPLYNALADAFDHKAAACENSLCSSL